VGFPSFVTILGGVVMIRSFLVMVVGPMSPDGAHNAHDPQSDERVAQKSPWQTPKRERERESVCVCVCV
jgi:hypothetical protein